MGPHRLISQATILGKSLSLTSVVSLSPSGKDVAHSLPYETNEPMWNISSVRYSARILRELIVRVNY